MKKQPFRRALRLALQRRLQALAARHRARQPATAHAERHSDTRGALRLWRWRSSDAINREEPS